MDPHATDAFMSWDDLPALSLDPFSASPAPPSRHSDWSLSLYDPSALPDVTHVSLDGELAALPLVPPAKPEPTVLDPPAPPLPDPPRPPPPASNPSPPLSSSPPTPTVRASNNNNLLNNTNNSCLSPSSRRSRLSTPSIASPTLSPISPISKPPTSLSKSTTPTRPTSSISKPPTLSLKAKREREAALFPKEVLADLEGTTSAEVRKMNPSQRELVLYKRKLRNRLSARRSRQKRQATLSELQTQVDELRDLSARIVDVGLGLQQENERLRARLGCALSTISVLQAAKDDRHAAVPIQRKLGA
ncbi:hypothetical protein BWQ96_00551 [Gracilariopsis chorda]|uniref:BZIP domain-containing protein n=1 Tax=Gracilariopsis chorda TaxID=448386 RepID=A0A2V3J5T7_9FLOR|nr:hypothetical protein BWQ96_00551 [Gracilariopsis chorda]|eukprot:PXF49673.1 hypothetical protein BWQ96_00551 [Gracilariopsis chorda]